jgi:hypothetical protein
VWVSVRTGPIKWSGWWALFLWSVGWLIVGVGMLCYLAVCRPRTTGALLALAGAAWLVAAHPYLTAIGAALLVELVHLWSVSHTSSWRRHGRTRLLSWWRSVWVYRRRWRTAMQVAELDRVDRDGQLRLPRLGRWRPVRCTPTTDLVRIRGLLGQRFSDWETAGPMLAHVFGAADYRLHRGDNRRLILELVRGPVGTSWNRDGYELGADTEQQRLERAHLTRPEPPRPAVHELRGVAVPRVGELRGDRVQRPRLGRAQPPD